MFTFILLLHRKADMSAADFQAYWHDVHGPIAAKMPGLKGYLQMHAQPGAKGDAPACDGIAQLIFDSGDAMKAAFGSNEGKAAVADLANFADTSRVTSFPADVRTIV
jgi:uncharacterized protein (TIGR02118 family)